MKSFSKSLMVICLLALGGCGGGGAGPFGTASLVNSAIFDTAQPNSSRNLEVMGVNTNSLTSISQSAQLVYPVTLNGSLLAGTIQLTTSNPDFDYEVDLNSGGTAFLKGGADNTEYLFLFSTGGATGVAGEVTPSMPAITNAMYNGSGSVLVNDGSNVTEFSGNAVMDANFQAGNLDVVIIGAGTLNIDNARIAGNSINGGSLSLSGNFANLPSGNVAPQHRGRFFGPDAAEIGGAFVLNDTAGAGPVEIIGTYSGAR